MRRCVNAPAKEVWPKSPTVAQLNSHFTVTVPASDVPAVVPEGVYEEPLVPDQAPSPAASLDSITQSHKYYEANFGGLPTQLASKNEYEPIRDTANGVGAQVVLSSDNYVSQTVITNTREKITQRKLDF